MNTKSNDCNVAQECAGTEGERVMGDRELLELAAKGAGIDVEWRRSAGAYYYDDEETGREEWRPLDDDGQALRVAMKLGFHIKHWVYACQIEDSNGHEWPLVHMGECEGGICHAARRAIVIAAAEIGKGL